MLAALAHAKRTGQPLAVLFIDLDHFRRVNDTLGHQIGDQMLRAVAERLQPVLRNSGTLCRIGAEALIRWQHPTAGLLSAADVIPMAESSNLIIDIGTWVLDAACRQYRSWVDAGVQSLRIAVNLSARQLRDPGFVSTVASALEAHRMPREFLELEVTESSLQNSEAAVSALRRVESLGVSISIDDFGTGYSCMSSLKLLPIRRVKIDQSFVKDLSGERNDCAIATAIIALGHELGLRVIAEGIDTREQADFIRAAGCDELQGYLFSTPLPAEQLLELLRRHDQLKH